MEKVAMDKVIEGVVVKEKALVEEWVMVEVGA